MENIFIEFLPPWVETGLQPAFYDKESGTVLQQISRMYPKINELIKSNNELGKEFVKLHDYVHDYFDNLDVQEEVNNKLEDMAESGDLATIIAQFLEMSPVFAYHTIAEMAGADNLADGCIAKVLGKTNADTGDGSFYRIRTKTGADTPDGVNLVAITGDNTIIAQIIPDAGYNYLSEEINDILSPQQFKNKKFLLVGDSYATGYQGAGQVNIEGFFTKVVNKLNLNAQIVCSNGYGFRGIGNNLKWQDLLENTTITNKSQFTDIIIAGGMNDRGTDADLTLAMEATFSYLKTNFPNAEIHVACVGKYAKNSTTSNLTAMRRIATIYKAVSIRNGHKYINGSDILLHNMGWFISDDIHPNTTGENQLAYGIEQYIVNGEISHFMNVTTLEDYQSDTLTPETGISHNLSIYSSLDKDCVTWYFSGAITFSSNITINNLTDITIGRLTNSYLCGSANNQGLCEYVEGYVYSPDTQYSGSPFVKVGFRIYNDNNNDIHLKAFTVSDDGGYKQLTINEIAFPYGAIQCRVNSRTC